MSGNGLKVLVVDDDKFLLDMYSIKFSEHDFTVETVSGAEEALTRIESGFVPMVCLVDIVMPGMDGLELVKKLKARADLANTAIIILSNLGQKDDVDKGLAVGADGYIIKATATPSEVVAKTIDIAKQKGISF
ncbi:MAG: response regulator [Candidatus Vogelbacteria bacterium]|nr:response regulator [Candidatus Vogelbacteria bacterium]